MKLQRLKYKKPNHSITLHEGDLSSEAAIAACDRGVLCWDIETTGLDWQKDTIQLCNLFIPSTTPGGTGQVHLVKPGSGHSRNMLDLLEASSILKIFHFAMFDLRFMYYHWGASSSSNVACTKVCSKLLSPERAKHSLGPLVNEHFGVTLDKSLAVSDWTKGFEGLTAEQKEYAANDVVFLSPLLGVFQELMPTYLWNLAENAFNHIPTRVELEVRGYKDVYTY